MTDELNLTGGSAQTIESVEEFKFDKLLPIKGFPELRWAGKRPFTSTQFYPAQKKESYGEAVDGWMNRLYWGDNLQVMSHLLKNFRGKIDLIYIDPPFDSKADYKKKISIKGNSSTSDHSAFEEKQYTDLWVDDNYLQYIYERIVLSKELLSHSGSIFVHCDDEKNYFIRSVLNEVFGVNNFHNEIIWKRSTATGLASKRCGTLHDTIYWFSKSSNYKFFMQHHEYDEKYLKRAKKDQDGRLYVPIPTGNPGPRPNLYYEYRGYWPHPNGYKWTRERMEKLDREGRLIFPENPEGRIQYKQYLDEMEGMKLQDIWTDIPAVNPVARERNGYPTQKPEALLDRIIKMTTEPGDLVFDCFMGSGTTQSSAMRLGRRFIGADINTTAIETTIKRLNAQLRGSEQSVMPLEGDEEAIIYSGFDVYNVNNYDVFRNPVEAKDILKEALELQPLERNGVFDGVKDGYMVKIMPVNRISTRQDLNELITGLDQKAYQKRYEENPNKVVDKIMLVCMGHEADLRATLQDQLKPFEVDVQILDVLRDKSHLEFKRSAEAKVEIHDGRLVVSSFYPMNLMQKLSLQHGEVEDWRQLVESIKIDWNFDGAVLSPMTEDVPDGSALVKGAYDVPKDAGTIRIKITDLLSESIEMNVLVEGQE